MRHLQDSSNSSSGPSRGFRQVASVANVEELIPYVVKVEGREIGIYRFRGKYYAYENYCPHQGGPLLEGEVRHNLECEVSNGRRVKEYHSDVAVNITCPWHSVEFDLETGLSRSGSDLRLQPIQVKVVDSAIWVEV